MPARRILIAEDEESIIASLEFLMRQALHEVRVARDGDEALRLVDEFQPDLVLLDLMLPRRSGLEVCGAIRAGERQATTRVLMLTAKGGSGEIARGMAAGADDYLVKPFSTRDLVGRVRALLESGGARA
jgi:two-component system, OmpR family, alkaline phosphatase synthesis response regulator PhoP